MSKLDIVDILKQEHAQVQELYNDYKFTKDLEERKKIFNQFIWALCAHSAAEEAIVYNAIESAGTQGKELGRKSREDHDELKKLLADLSTADDETEFDQKFDLAFKTFWEHVQMEEEEDIPFLQEHVSLNQRQNVAQTFLMKKYLIPVRPPSYLPEKKAALDLALTVLTTPADKVRTMFLTQDFPML